MFFFFLRLAVYCALFSGWVGGRIGVVEFLFSSIFTSCYLRCSCWVGYRTLPEVVEGVKALLIAKGLSILLACFDANSARESQLGGPSSRRHAHTPPDRESSR